MLEVFLPGVERLFEEEPSPQHGKWAMQRVSKSDTDGFDYRTSLFKPSTRPDQNLTVRTGRTRRSDLPPPDLAPPDQEADSLPVSALSYKLLLFPVLFKLAQK